MIFPEEAGKEMLLWLKKDVVTNVGASCRPMRHRDFVRNVL